MPDALPDADLRAQVNEYLIRVLPKNPKKKREIIPGIEMAIQEFPQVLDYYVREKEDTGEHATSVARERVDLVRSFTG